MGADAGAVDAPLEKPWWGASPEKKAAFEIADHAAKLAARRMTSRRCLQLDTGKGAPCENPTTQWFEGHGWRCRHHIPEGMEWPRGRVTQPDALPDPQPDPPPNNGKIESVEDANNLIGWATQQLALGLIPESRCRGVINGANRYIRNINEIEGKERMDRMEKGMRDAGILK